MEHILVYSKMSGFLMSLILMGEEICERSFNDFRVTDLIDHRLKQWRLPLVSVLFPP